MGLEALFFFGLVHRDNPLRIRFETQWAWFTYFFDAFAARAFMSLDLRSLEAVDARRRTWVHEWLELRGLPAIATGSYDVKSFRPIGELPATLAPLARGDLVRLCFKPPFA